MSPGSPPAVAVISVGDPAAPTTWSGTTVGVLKGLSELGVTTNAIDLKLPRGVEQAALVAGAARTANRFDAESASLMVALRSRLLRAKLGSLRLDGAIQVGSTFTVPPGTAYVTLEDMTLRQALDVHPVFSRMSPSAIERWERQRAAIYAGARRCAAASHWAAGSLLEDYGLAAEGVAVVGLGANHLTSGSDSGREWSPPRFLFVGIDWERKGGPLLLRAFGRLRLEVPEAALDLVGGHPPIEQPGVSCHGLRSQSDPRDRELISDLFTRASCLVMPSLVEPFGIVHVEAGAAGIPSIGSSVGGPRDVIGPEGGLVVDPGDEEGLYRAMLRLSDPETARRMGAAARERSRLYTWKRVSERLLRALGLPAADGRKLAEFL